MSATNSDEGPAASRQPQPEAGGILHGEQNQGAERLSKPGGPLGGKAHDEPAQSQGRTPGDAAASDAPGESAGKIERKSAKDDGADAFDKADGDYSKGESKDGEKQTNGEGESKVASGSAQSESVNKMLAEADKQVKAQGMTTHPETEEKNKKIIQEEEDEKNKKKKTTEQSKGGGLHEKEQHLVGKIKGIVHHDKS